MDSKSFYREDRRKRFQKLVFCLKDADASYVLVPGKNYYISFKEYSAALEEAHYQAKKGFTLVVGEVA